MRFGDFEALALSKFQAIRNFETLGRNYVGTFVFSLRIGCVSLFWFANIACCCLHYVSVQIQVPRCPELVHVSVISLRLLFLVSLP